MKVILLANVAGVGKKDQIVEVSDGYANNFLFPRKLAVSFTKGSKDFLDRQKQQVLHEAAQKRVKALAIQAKLATITLTFTAKVGKEGKMFGTITAKQVEAELKDKHKVEIDKRRIINRDPINRLGVTKLEIDLDKDVIGVITINVIEGK